jgi:hypothetical protein
MKDYGKARRKITITSDGVPLSNAEYTIIRRIVSVLELHDLEIILKNFKVEESTMLKIA